MKRRDKEEWKHILQNIKGFLEFNPLGTEEDLFEYYGEDFRLDYKNYKPANYTFPNISTKTKNAKKNTKIRRSVSQTLHYKYLRVLAPDVSIEIIYDIMKELGIYSLELPSDWKQNKETYKDLFLESLEKYTQKNEPTNLPNPENDEKKNTKTSMKKVEMQPELFAENIPSVNKISAQIFHSTSFVPEHTTQKICKDEQKQEFEIRKLKLDFYANLAKMVDRA